MKTTHPSSTKILTLLAAALTLSIASMQAGILFSEDFNYTVDQTLFGNSGGTGLTGSWVRTGSNGTDSNAMIRDTSLSYTVGVGGPTITASKTLELIGIGDGAVDRNFATRQIGTSISAATTSDVYIRFLVQLSSGVLSGNDGMRVGIGSTNGTGVDHNAAGLGGNATKSNYYVISGAGTSKESAGNAVSVGTTHMIVMKLTSNGTNYTTSSIWFDPISLTETAPDLSATGSLIHSTLNYIGIGMTRLETSDKILIGNYVAGTAWADVIPEPTTAAMLFLGGVSVLILRNRRRGRS